MIEHRWKAVQWAALPYLAAVLLLLPTGVWDHRQLIKPSVDEGMAVLSLVLAQIVLLLLCLNMVRVARKHSSLSRILLATVPQLFWSLLGARQLPAFSETDGPWFELTMLILFTLAFFSITGGLVNDRLAYNKFQHQT